MGQGRKSPHYRKEFRSICKKCDAQLIQEDVLTHMTYKHCDSYFYKCHLCRNYSGTYRSSLFQHQKDKHGVRYYYISCPLCMKFSSPEEKEVITHLVNVHSRMENLYICNYCSFQSKFDLDAHFKEIHSHFACVFHNCQAVCQNSTHLFQHYIGHHFPKLTLFFGCSECNQMFPKKNSLYQHKRDKHRIWEEEDEEEYEEDEEEYEEEEDEEEYEEEEEDEEEYEEEDEEEYEEEDEEEYEEEEDEEEYEEEDEEEETFIELGCPVCSYTTYKKKHFEQHSINKHPDYFFNCKFKDCSYQTKLFWSITQHTVDKHLSHTFLNYDCYICEISYRKINSLIQHLRDKHFHTCSLCNTYEDDLSDHILSDPDHYYNVFSCRICYEEYEEKYELVDHISDNHVYITPLVKRLCYGN